MSRSIVSSVFFLLAFGFFVFSGILFATRYYPQDLSFAQVPVSTHIRNARVPTQIALPSLSKSFPIFPSRIKNGKWETTDKGVSYLVSSGIPGENGNAIFYSHNYPHLLSDLDDVEIGSVIIIHEADRTAKQFSVIEKKVVKPTDVSILEQTPDARLTLYTCTGFLDSERLVIVALLNNK